MHWVPTNKKRGRHCQNPRQGCCSSIIVGLRNGIYPYTDSVQQRLVWEPESPPDEITSSAKLASSLARSCKAQIEYNRISMNQYLQENFLKKVGFHPNFSGKFPVLESWKPMASPLLRQPDAAKAPTARRPKRRFANTAPFPRRDPWPEYR